MARFLVLLLLSTAAHAQRNDLWSNPNLTARGVQPGEQQLLLRQDMSACHNAAFEGARTVDDETKRKALGVALFNRCMAERGWQVRESGSRKPASKRETAT